ncbi:hypothetical protein [Kordia jejudonensis]|uniref:hypothetical protein n=1 Tax=Kordia jejudonensis TaxID=1348245 RepID=UPI0006294469|nr:hypothetical protein [Kordia jejudonensis]
MADQYYAYRVFLRQVEWQLKFKTKEEAYIEAFDKIKEKGKIQFFDWGNEHIIYYIKSLGRDIHVLQLARKHVFQKPIAGDKKIEKVSDVDYPFIYLIFHVKYQIVLVQKNTAVFQELDAVKAKIERFFIERMGNHSVGCSLIEITDKRDFWAKLEEMDVIEKVTMTYAPPNFFGGKKSVDKITKEVQEETNYEKFKIILENKVQGLKFGYETFKDHIQRLSSGAGDFIVNGLVDGVPKILKKFKIPFKKISLILNKKPKKV